MHGQIISIHSFRRGTGKSSLTANVTALLAAEGRRVGVVDTNTQSPSLHILFGLDEEETTCSLNDYLWGECDIEQTAHDVTSSLGFGVSAQPNGADIKGQVFLVPSSTQVSEITRVLRKGYDVDLLNAGFRKLIEELALDVLVVDTHAGLNEETLLSLALSDALAIILRTDQQDYQGTAIMVEVARQLDVPRVVLIVNEVPSVFDLAEVKSQVEQTYNCEVAAVLPYSDEVMTLEDQTLTDAQITTVEDFARRVAGGLEKAETDFETRRQIIDLPDVRVTLAIEDGQKAVYIRCLVGEGEMLSIESSTSRTLRNTARRS